MEKIPVVIGGNTYDLPPLNLNGYRLVVRLMKETTIDPSTEGGIANLPVILAASLMREDPTRNGAWISENMLGSEYTDAFGQMLKLLYISGFKKPEEMGETPVGEEEATTQIGMT